MPTFAFGSEDGDDCCDNDCEDAFAQAAMPGAAGWDRIGRSHNGNGDGIERRRKRKKLPPSMIAPRSDYIP